MKDFKERLKDQDLKWAEGHPYHNDIDNLCCIDFSCCHPELFEKDATKRWAYYHSQHGNMQ